MWNLIRNERSSWETHFGSLIAVTTVNSREIEGMPQIGMNSSGIMNDIRSSIKSILTWTAKEYAEKQKMAEVKRKVEGLILL
jgi:hypothetical protein